MYRLLQVVVFLAGCMPSRLGYAAADVVGVVTYLCNRKARRQAEANLRHVLGPRAGRLRRTMVALRAFRTAARNYYDLFRLPTMNLACQQCRATVVGWHHLEEALANGKGVIVVAPHMGNFDLMVHLAVDRGVPVTLPVERLRSEKVFQLMKDLRAQHGLSVVAADNGALRSIHRALRNNEAVVIAADRDVLGNGAPVRFFGETTTLPNAPAVLSLRTGAPILVGYALRLPDGNSHLELFPPLAPPSGGDARESTQSLTQAVTDALEGMIRQHPDQWLAFEPVWRD